MRNEEREAGVNEKVIKPQTRNGKGCPISRRLFTGGISKLIALGAFSHFTLLAGKAHAEEVTGGDVCPGGALPDDVCSGVMDPDKCPGERPPADYCPDSGAQPEDICNTSLPAPVDVCVSTDEGSDQCEGGSETNVECPAGSGGIALDVCPTGRSPEPDECLGIPPTNSQGDYCPGGDPVAGIDICVPEGQGSVYGDECAPEKPGEASDECTQEGPKKDSCIDGTPDVCPDGKNTLSGSGFDDACGNDLVSTGSDMCPDGTDAKDLCEVTWAGVRETDVCPSGGIDVDTCGPKDPATKSDDYCLGGQPTSDQCFTHVGDEDECPGGKPDVDSCPTGEAPEDECTAAGGCAGGDQVTGADDPVLCLVPSVDGCYVMDQDHAE